MRAWEDYLLLGNLGVFISIDNNNMTNTVEFNTNIGEMKYRKFGVSRRITGTMKCDSTSKHLT
jgi:hypothetical protein